MADGFTCDRCGKVLLADETVRYRVTIDVFAAYDPMEITSDDLRRNHAEEIRRLLEEIEQTDPRTLQDQVHRHMDFDLCPPCQRIYLKNPLGRA